MAPETRYTNTSIITNFNRANMSYSSYHVCLNMYVFFRVTSVTLETLMLSVGFGNTCAICSRHVNCERGYYSNTASGVSYTHRPSWANISVVLKLTMKIHNRELQKNIQIYESHFRLNSTSQLNYIHKVSAQHPKAKKIWVQTENYIVL